MDENKAPPEVLRAIEVLNRAVKADQDAMLALVNHRVPANNSLINDPTIQCAALRGEEGTMGILGLINGLFGTRPDGWGYITMDCDHDGPDNPLRVRKIHGFRVTNR